MIGSYLKQYQILEALGEGGFARVYLGLHVRIQRKVAIKVLHQVHLADTYVRERFLQEAAIAARIGGQHHIVTIYDYDEQDGLAYFVMEYVEGRSLKQVMTEHAGRPADPALVRAVALALGDALDYAHANGVLHRDIKPANVMLANDGRIVLMDFGVAVIQEMTARQGWTIVGTPAYMSPEQATGQPLDARGEVYSFAVLLYELLTGRPPYQADTPVALMYKHVNDPLPRPRHFNPALPEPVEWVLLKGLAKRPEDRHPSAGALAADLVAALGPGPGGTAGRRDGEIAGRGDGATARRDGKGLAGGETTVDVGEHPGSSRSGDPTTVGRSGRPPSSPPVGGMAGGGTLQYGDPVADTRGSGPRVSPPRDPAPAAPTSRAATTQVAGAVLGVLLVGALAFGLWSVFSSSASGSTPTREASQPGSPAGAKPGSVAPPTPTVLALAPSPTPATGLRAALSGNDVCPYSEELRNRIGPIWLAVGRRLDDLYTIDRANNHVVKLATSGTPLGRWGGPGAGPGQFREPHGLAVDADGNVYVADGDNLRVQKLSSTGQPLAQWPVRGALQSPIDVALDGQGNVYVLYWGAPAIQKLSPTGQLLASWGAKGTGPAQFASPSALTLDADGNVYVADTDNHRVQKLSPTGQPLASWGTPGRGPGQFQSPTGVAVDGSGNVYVADRLNHRIQKLSSTGQPLASWGKFGNGPDELSEPHGLALDSKGDLFVADNRNCRIQKLVTSEPTTR